MKLPSSESFVLALGICVCASPTSDPKHAPASQFASNQEQLQPSQESAKENANLIFNSVHSAGRQWGSSLYHNGFSFFPARVPAGTLLYHGSREDKPPSGLEWLAFEIEHAENFAHSVHWRPGAPRPGPPGDGQKPPAQQEPLNKKNSNDEEEPNYRGYLQTYQATRDLNLLYLDGTSAGKTDMGTLDSQDLILRENKTNHDDIDWGEMRRARDMCDILPEWGYDGVVRMEIGFEVILCDFYTGAVDLVSVTRTFLSEDKLGNGDTQGFEWARAVAERYDGIGGDRLQIDYSSMVSGLFFPINISHTDPERPDLKRLASATLDELKDIKSYLKDVATRPRSFKVNWQAIVDMIVSRFQGRLVSLASNDLGESHFIDQLESTILAWVDAPPLPGDVNLSSVNEEVNGTANAIKQCRKHYLRPALAKKRDWSVEDELIHTAIDSVLGAICEELFAIRASLLEADDRITSRGSYLIVRDQSNKKQSEAVIAGRARVQNLMDTLGWTVWKQKQPCPPNEVLFIAMWPFGDTDDHWNPGCRPIEHFRRMSGDYWDLDMGPRPPAREDDNSNEEL